MSTEDGEGENPYRPRRVGPPGPGYNAEPPSRWRRSKGPKPPKRKKKAEAAPPPAAPPEQTPPPPPPQVEQQPSQAPPAEPQPPPPSTTEPSPTEAPPPPEKSPRKRKGRKIDYLVGIPLGLLLGIGIVTAFVFLGSEGTIDAPRIKNSGATGVTGETSATGASGSRQSASQAPASAPSPKPAPSPPKLPVIRIEGSNPPLEAGPVKIRATKGEPVRFRIESDGTVSIEIVGTGFTKDVSSGDKVTFTPKKAGQFPTFVSGNDVNVATFDVSP